ncbi:phage repressor protein/antirepressor Ant [Lactobacillus acidophilus]|uniref:phage antirepressor n=1 Tax=Lactobacillus acidophilus TaxID=1579 RepID=UPI0021A28079|nr:phage antirepressor KilAC domain-containing protein [Lactobacillus acidophilus]MCT3603196.1 phage repressor protein/antirepressor Ant [Lactobacillus acidophilus]MCT3624179.1 phage repressor protein/antirepressor Ant [Lactobacillus acidophilus]
MNDLQLFNFEGQKVRTLKIEDEPYFVGKDVAEILGYAEPRRAVIQHVDKEDRKSLGRKDWGDLCPNLWTNPSDFTNKAVVNESGVYALIFGSKMPNARKFKRWVTSEVLPAIRKHGAYMTDAKAFDVVNNKDGLASLLQQAADQLKEKDIQIAKMKPKALFADAVASSKSTVLIGDLAKMIKQNGVHYLYIFKDGLAKRLAMGPNNLFKWMRQNHWLIARKGSDYNSPTQKSMSMGLFEIKEKTIVHSDGHTTISKTPKVTGKGQQFFINLFLNA